MSPPPSHNGLCPHMCPYETPLKSAIRQGLCVFHLCVFHAEHSNEQLEVKKKKKRQDYVERIFEGPWDILMESQEEVNT